MVRTFESWHCTVSTVHDLTDMPFKSTVHAPQWLVSQPMCGPVCCSFSRSVWIKSSRGSTTTSTSLPLSLKETACFFAMFASVVFLLRRALARRRERAHRHFARHRRLVRLVAPLILDRRADAHREACSVGDRSVIELFAAQRIFGGLRAERGRTDVGECDAHIFDHPALQLDEDRGRRGREIAGLALQFGIAVARARSGD